MADKWCSKDIKVSLVEFSNSTSFHGVKFIGTSKSTCRRAMWILFVVGSLAAVIAQIVDRVQYFYSWPLNVDAKIKYTHTLRFPAVTICNQNAFRASQAAEHGLYKLVEELYSKDSNITAETLDRYGASNYTIQDLYTLLSHRKEDLIVSCTWRKKHCGPDDFRVILTDHGLCFVFNQMDMMVSASGVGSGLQLLLNVEQYEYMPGPHGAAGVLLHNADETPLVYALGEAIPTGAHAFLGIHTQMIDNTPAPYGECADKKLNHTSFYSKDECYLDCFTSFAAVRCGCRDMNMPSSTGSPPVCSLEDYFDCFKDLREIFDKQYLEQCSCPIPCHVTQYDSTLSYATISNYMVSKIIPESHESALKRKVLESSEATLRYDDNKYYLLKSLFDSMHLNFERIKGMLHNISNHINHQMQELETIRRGTERVYLLKEKLYNYQEYAIEKNFLRAREAMEERTLRNLVDMFFEFALSKQRQIKRLVSMDLDGEKERSYLYNSIVDVIVVRREINERARENITELIEAFQSGRGIFNYSFEDIPASHNAHIVPRPLFKFALNRNNYVAEHLPKLRYETFENIRNSLDMMLDIASISCYNTSVNETELYGIIEYFMKACREFMFSKSVVFTESLDYPLKVIKERKDQFRTTIGQFISVQSVLEQTIWSLSAVSKNVSQEIVTGMDSLIRRIGNYFDNNELRFMDISAQLLDDDVNKMLINLNVFFETLHTRNQMIRDSWYLLFDAITDIWKTILIDEDMLEYYKFAKLTEFLQPYEDVKDNMRNKFSPFIDNDITQHITNKDFDAAFSNMHTYAEEFKEQLDIDTDFVRQNYMQLDIFFRQMSYDWVKQQAAYDIFALFCDIGGAMGLFIGASMLTVVEIIELLVTQVNVCRLFRSRKAPRGREPA